MLFVKCQMSAGARAHPFNYTYLIKGYCMSEYLDHVIRSYKGKSWGINISHAINGIPVRRKRTSD
jgi:hypothetical protein